MQLACRVLVKKWIEVPSQRSHLPSLTVILRNYCSKKLAGSFRVTLKDFWIVQIGQDSCYRSLYVIECSLINLLPELGHTLVPLLWLLWSDHTLPIRWEWQAIIPSCPAVTIVFYHAMEVSCYHSFLAVKLQLCLGLVTLGLGWEFRFSVPISGTPIGSGIPIPFLIPKIPVGKFFSNSAVEKLRNWNSNSKIRNSEKK